MINFFKTFEINRKRDEYGRHARKYRKPRPQSAIDRSQRAYDGG